MTADSQRAERMAALAAVLSAAVMIAQQVGSKATRDALFLSRFAPEDLPRVVIASAGAALLAVFLASRAFARFGPARAVPFTFAASASLYVVEWALSASAPRPVAVVLYLHTAVFGALVVSGFWSVVTERFDPHTAKRVVSRIGLGSTFGGVAGGLLAERVGAWSEAGVMLLILAALNAAAAYGVSRIGTLGQRPLASAVDDASGLSVLRRAPYLQALAALVILTAMSAGLLDYAFKAEAARHFERGSDALLSFFAIFHTAAAVLSLLAQMGLTRVALTRLGVGGTAATLPIVVLVTAAIAAAVPRLASVVIARCAELVLANSVFRSGYELLYTPVALARKRSTKALIDVAGNRLGDAMGSGVTLIVLAVAASPVPIILGLAAAIALASLVIARRLHRGYVNELSDSLRSGTPHEFMHAATLQTLSTLGLDREMLSEQLAAQSHSSWGEHLSRPPPLAREEPKALDGIDAPPDDPIHERARTLRDGDAAEVRSLLEEDVLDMRLVPFAIALLARRDVYHEAIAALRRTVVEHERPPASSAERPPGPVPLLANALTDIDQPFAIRRRLPRVLEVSESLEASEALARGFDDDRFEVRYFCALALARITDRVPSLRLRPSVDRVHEVVKKELETPGRKVWDGRRLLDDDTREDAPLLDGKVRERIHRSVEHVFTLLSLSYDPEPLRLSLIALAGEDKTLRGTALEYLESVLPEDIRAALFPMLDAREQIRKKGTRPRQEIVKELQLSMQSMDAAALQRAIEKQHEK